MLLEVLTVFAFATQMPPACIDPATPLTSLARSYAEWPAAPSPRAQETFARFRTYLIAGSAAEYRELLREYQKLDDIHRANTHVQLALGILYATGPDLNPQRAGGYRHRYMLHSSQADDRASRILADVAEREASQWLAPVALTHMALATRENGRMKQAIAVVRDAMARAPENVTLQLAWHDLLIAQNKAAEARAFWNTHPASQCAGANHARAEALILTGDKAGTPLYLAALADADSTAVHRFHDDVRVIFSTGEFEQYDRTPVEQRREWLQLFWERSAAKSGITVHARIAQHMERTQLAHTKYRKAVERDPRVTPGLEGLASDAEYDSEDARDRAFQQQAADRLSASYQRQDVVPWDDRGVIYVRQGEPDTTFQAAEGAGTRIPRNETWLYARDTPPWLFTFTRPGDVGPDYYWTFTIGCGLTGSRSAAGNMRYGGNAVRRMSGGQLEAREFYLDLAGFDERYLQLASYCGKSAVRDADPFEYRRAVNELRRYYEPLMRTVTRTESALPRFRQPLRMIVAAYSFRDAAGRPEITALTWIPTPELQDSTPTRRLRLTYTLVDDASAPLRHDTIAVVPPNVGKGLLRDATTWRNVRLSGGRLLVMAIDGDDPGLGTYRNRYVTLPFENSGPAISDLVVGEPDAQGLLVRGERRISPLPDHAIRNGTDFRLYYEVYGVTAGTQMETTIRVVRNERAGLAELLRLHPGRREQREITMSGIAETDRRGIVMQDVAVAGDLLPGQYTIAVTIRTAAGNLTRTSVLNVD